MEPTQSNSGPPGGTAEPAITPEMETLLERRAAGDKTITASEHGKIGAFVKWRLPRFLGGKDREASQPAGAASPLGQSLRLGSMAAAEASPDSLEPVEIDDGLCQRTATALLNRGDAFITGKIERQARETCRALGFDDEKTEKVVNRFNSEAGLPGNDKKLLVDLAPDVCRELGIDPRQFALLTVGGVIGLHVVNVWGAMDELKEMVETAKREREKKESDPPAPKVALPAVENVKPL